MQLTDIWRTTTKTRRQGTGTRAAYRSYNSQSKTSEHQQRKSMLKHIVMWKLKEHAEGADRAANAIEMKRRLDECASIVPGQHKFEVVVAQPGLEATYDVVLYSEFEDKAALEAYVKHPLHQAVIPFIGAIREARQCMDYEV
jgi:quinol monooxygenase YgiN